MEGAIMAAFYKSVEELRRATRFQCSSGNFTFDESQTLGACHRCNDVTSQLVEREGGFDDFLDTMAKYEHGWKYPPANALYLSNGHLITNSNGCRLYDNDGDCPTSRFTSTTFGTGNPNKTVSMKGVDTLLWSMSFIYPNFAALSNSGLFAPSMLGSKGNQGNAPAVTWPTIKLDASECALYYCLKNVTSTVKVNELTESFTEFDGVTRTPGSRNDIGSSSQVQDLLRENARKSEFQAPADEARSLEFHKMWSVLGYNSLGLRDPSRPLLRSAEVQEDSIKSLSAHFQGLFRWKAWFDNATIRESLQNISGIMGLEDAVGFNGATTLEWLRQEEVVDQKSRPPMLGQLMPLSPPDHRKITSIFERMAFSMTNEMRRTSQPEDQAGYGRATMTHTGLVGGPIVLYRVVWPWVALHVASVVCACIFLLMTVYSSDHQDDAPLWKSSSLAAIRRGHDIGDLFGSAGSSVRDMEDIARRTYVGKRRINQEEAKPWIEETVEPAAKPRMEPRTP
ncbi:hypothetical protein CMUS01_13026 [Colletotrichum musicola]|uniref:Uncharacterized protein n=1 Tax=Colletotrichum musicola TaxID=2175873 RepID=A0A8H6MXG4_9PEZI|nr:hypothetical protein CMUS01_13026 [Colletotrichum musicola]